MAAGDLLDRLTGAVEPKLPVHQFWGAFTEWTSGEVTRADVISAFTIAANEEEDLDWLKAQYDGQANGNKKVIFTHFLHSIFALAEDGYFGYDSKIIVRARINRIS